jgi:hypothetical protein
MQKFGDARAPGNMLFFCFFCKLLIKNGQKSKVAKVTSEVYGEPGEVSA